MKKLLAILALLASAGPAWAAPAAPVSPPKPERVLVEIYRIAPGQHTAFLEEIARYDEANRRAGLPARNLYVHSDGADWDFILIQPAATPPDKVAALDKAWEEMKLPSGADFFLQFRRFVAEHTDTFASGPTTAADFLATRKAR
jgi:MoxR-like ATPase